MLDLRSSALLACLYATGCASCDDDGPSSTTPAEPRAALPADEPAQPRPSPAPSLPAVEEGAVQLLPVRRVGDMVLVELRPPTEAERAQAAAATVVATYGNDQALIAQLADEELPPPMRLIGSLDTCEPTWGAPVLLGRYRADDPLPDAEGKAAAEWTVAVVAEDCERTHYWFAIPRSASVSTPELRRPPPPLERSAEEVLTSAPHVRRYRASESWRREGLGDSFYHDAYELNGALYDVVQLSRSANHFVSSVWAMVREQDGAMEVLVPPTFACRVLAPKFLFDLGADGDLELIRPGAAGWDAIDVIEHATGRVLLSVDATPIAGPTYDYESTTYPCPNPDGTIPEDPP